MEKIDKRLNGWKGGALSLGGRLTLLNACLSSILIYSMFMYLLPKTILKKIDVIRKRFFWQGGGLKKKYHLVKWRRISQLKKKGGLGVKDLWKLNICLLCKWWWQLETNEGLWQKIVRKKYMNNSCITLSLKKKPSNSHVWNQLLSIKDFYLAGRKMLVGRGDSTSFWEDSWICDSSLKEKFPPIFATCNESNDSVALMARQGWRISFRRWLNEDL